MKTTLKLIRRVQFGFAAVVVVLLVVGVVSFRSLSASVDRERWVQHTHEILEHLGSLRSAIERVATAYDGFALTGEETFLQSSRASMSLVDGEQKSLKILTADNPDQQRRLATLAGLAERGSKLDETIVRLRGTGGPTTVADFIRTGQGGQILTGLRTVAHDVDDEERRLLLRRGADAEQRFLETKVALILGSGLGLLVAVLGGWIVQRDYLARAIAQATVLESEERYRILLESVHDYAIFMLDRHGKVVSWNAGAQRIKGYTAAEIIGQNFSCFYPQDDIDQGKPQEELRIAAANGRCEIERWRVRKDGSRFMANLVLTAARSPSGNLVGFSEVSRDISARKESEARYRGLLEAAPDAMVVVNQAGEIVLLNLQAEKKFGYHRDELVGQKVKNIIPEGFAERLLTHGTGSPEDPIVQQMGTGIELYGRRKDGGDFPIEIMLSPLESPDGILVTAAIRDISARKESEAKYRGLLEAAPDAMVVVNQAGEIVLLNLQAEKQFGYRRDELLGQKVTNLIPEGFAERLLTHGTGSPEDPIVQQMGTGIELYGRRKDGGDFPIEIMLSPLTSPEGILVTAAIRDISARKESEAKYRGLLEAAPDAMVVVNQAGEIVLLNLQAEKKFGYHRDELVGQKVKNIIPEGFAERLLTHGTGSPDDTIVQQMGTGIELYGRRKNGGDFPIEIMLSPLASPEGILVTAAIRDISARKESEAKYRGLLEAAPDAMVVVNQAGKIVLLNLQAEKQFEYHRDELLGQKVTNIIPEGFAERLLTHGTGAPDDPLVQQMGTGIELYGRRKNGGDFPIEIMLSPLESPDEILVTAAIRDITERKKSEAQLLKTVGELKRSNDELEQFAYVASHDLQEPLRMVASYTQLLAKRYTGRLDADADEFIAYAVDGSNRMQGLIQDLLAYSRAGANGKALRKILSEDALNEALTNLRATIEESGAVVTHDALPAITTDDTQITQVFQNLVGNAIKYRSAEAPRVHVSATNGGDEWVFSVRDNGLGIDPQYFDRIFVLFQRLHGRDEFKGTGIGLAICKKMLERLGGRIWVESQPEKGSTFYFALPARGEK